jgi:molybdopterin converting factor small subunit
MTERSEAMSEISVKITAMSQLGRYLGWTERLLPTKSQTVRGVLSEIAQKDGEFRDKVYNPTSGRFHEEIVILIDGINIKQRNGLDTPVFNNSEIACFYPFGGG